MIARRNNKMTDRCLVLDGNRPGTEDHFYEFPQTVARKWFGEGRYGRLGTIGDGSCFFHSICYATNAKDYRDASYSERQKIAHGLREGLARHFTEDAYASILAEAKTSKVPKAFGAMKAAMAEPKTWAEEIMIRWTSSQLGLNIVFLNVGNNTNNMYCGVHNKVATEAFKRCAPTWPVVIVVWVDHSHFELLCRLDEIREDSIRLRPFFDPQVPEDQETIEKVLAAYVMACNV